MKEKTTPLLHKCFHLPKKGFRPDVCLHNLSEKLSLSQKLRYFRESPLSQCCLYYRQLSVVYWQVFFVQTIILSIFLYSMPVP